MEDIEKDHHYSEAVEHTAPSSEHHEEKQDAPVTRRLRDRALLKKRKEEAQEKDTFLWVFGEQTRSKRPRKVNGRGKRTQQVKEPELEPETEFHPKPELHAELEVPHEHTAIVLEHLEHKEDPVTTVTEDVTLIVHDEDDGHVPQSSISSLTVEKDNVPEAEPVPVVEEPEALHFPLDAGQEEPHYYTPLL